MPIKIKGKNVPQGFAKMYKNSREILEHIEGVQGEINQVAFELNSLKHATLEILAILDNTIIQYIEDEDVKEDE